ncbi:MAG TPA: helix-turn-helix domain-containing protein [Steroidobacteraceae bacterium]|jgi:AraC-like DNA-binding protein|nr:helix-turn-helix domain-containing protein [Steroidobacteraceae bacterium]
MREEQSDSNTYQPHVYTLDGPSDTVLADEHLPRDPDAMQQLLSSAHEDLARVGEILRTQRCSARLLGIDGSVIPLTGSANSIAPGNSEDSPLARVPALSAPIYDSQGRLFVSLQVIQGAADYSVSSQTLLRAMIECAARSITERWFRLAHCREWIVAAMRRDSPGTYLLLAADSGQGLVGADRAARQWLETRGLRFEPCLALSRLFRSGVGNLPPRSCGDAEVTLVTGSGEGWRGLVTPPNIGATPSCFDQRAVLHARPRLNSLTRALPGSDGDRQRDRAREAFGRVRQYVDAHLDSRLDVQALAQMVGMSASHFSRSFHKAVGVSPHTYVLQCRVMRAQELLATTQLPLTEIALTIGFSDQSHFSRRFHELIGMPPRMFRRLAGRSPR